jgi:hypothetical protein
LQNLHEHVVRPVSPFQAVARRLHEQGVSLLPILPGQKRPGALLKSGKWIGMVEWEQFCARLPTPHEIELWESFPDAGIGAALGEASGLCAIDLDYGSPEVRAAIEAAMPPSPVRKTGAKGYTAFYRLNPKLGSRKWTVDKQSVIELLGHGKQTVLPPTIHPDGMAYRWLTLDTLEDLAVAELPELPDDFCQRIDAALRPFQTNDDRGTKPERPAHDPSNPFSGCVAAQSVWQQINTCALAALDAWVPRLLPDAKRSRGGHYRATATWRSGERADSVGIDRKGIRDWGTDEGLTPLDLVMLVNDCDLDAAAAWLRPLIGMAEPEPSAAVVEPTFPDRGVSLEEGERLGREAVARFMAQVEWAAEADDPYIAYGRKVLKELDPAHRAALGALDPALTLAQTLGGGKTEIAVGAIATAPAGAYVNFLAPDHALGSELVSRIQRAVGNRHRVVQVFGRDQIHPSGERMCKDHDTAAEIQRCGLSVQQHLCKVKIREQGKPARYAHCPHFQTCLYQKQRADKDPAIRIGPHAYLALAHQYSPLPAAHLTIIDEDPTPALIRDANLPLAAISADDLRGIGITERMLAEQLWRFVLGVLAAQTPTAERMREVGISASDCRWMKTLWYRQVDRNLVITPSMTPEEKKAALAKVRQSQRALRVARFWALLAEVIDLDLPELRPFRVVEVETEEGLKEKRVEMVWSVDPKIEGPVMLLDGTANDEIVRRFFPGTEIARIDIKAEHYRAVQILDRAVSKTMIAYNLDGKLKSPKTKEVTRSRNNRGKLARLAEVVAASAAQNAERRAVPLFTYKSAAEALRKEHGVRLAEGGVEVGFQRHDGKWAGHLGNVRGLDRWRHAPAATIAGRLVTSPEGVETQARAVFFKDPRPIAYLPPGTTKLPKAQRAIRMADGTGRAVEVETHPDPLVAAVIDQMCRADLEQTVHRLRPVRRTVADAPLIVVATNVVLNLTIHETTTWNELIPPPLVVMRARGFALGEGRDAAEIASRLCDDLWKDADAFRQWRTREGDDDALKGSNSYKEYPIGVLSFETPSAGYRIRRSGARYDQVVYVNPARHPDARAALEAKLGALDRFEPLAATAKPAPDDDYNPYAAYFATLPSFIDELAA